MRMKDEHAILSLPLCKKEVFSAVAANVVLTLWIHNHSGRENKRGRVRERCDWIAAVETVVTVYPSPWCSAVNICAITGVSAKG